MKSTKWAISGTALPTNLCDRTSRCAMSMPAKNAVTAGPDCTAAAARTNAYHATGDIRGVYEYGCELFKKRMECAIMMQIAMQEEA